MRFLWWLVVTILALGVAALLAVVFWFPPSDPDSLALARERTARLSAFRLKKPLPGASVSTAALEQRLVEGGFKLGAPVLVRIYKLSFELELWMQRGNGYALFATYPICYFSGQLGPKIKHGDWQSPEGIYQVDARLLNPHSAHHRALNLGFPNTYDKQLGRAGVLLEVHGGCSSVGCYAITNPAIDDVYRLAEAALKLPTTTMDISPAP